MKSQLIEFALKNFGVHETPSPTTSNPKVLQFFADSGNAWVKDDSANAWCSAFMNAAAKSCSLPITGSLLARSWQKAGQPTKTPEIGDIAIFWRDSLESGHGHVSFFVREDEDGQNIWVLGGNQSDEVNCMKYAKSRLLEYRDITKPWPKFSFTRTLKQGDSGEDVKVVQKVVQAKVDGNFGPMTKSAVQTFQTLHNLVGDGIVGKLTQAELLKYI